MTLTTSDLFALLPLLLVTGTSVLVMMMIAFVRSHTLTAGLTLIGLLAAVFATLANSGQSPVQVTPLLVIDQYSLFFNLVILATSIVVTILCHGYFNKREGLQEELYILLLTTTLGALVMVSSNHFVSFFLGLELLGISLFALIAYPTTTLTKSGLPLEAALKYLVLSGVSTGFLSFGMALVYAASGALSLADIAIALKTTGLTYYAIGGIAMIVAGIGFKLSLVPFHMWTPDVYQGAPAPITAFVATISKGAVLAFLLRAFTMLDAYQYESVVFAIAAIAMASMLVGNLLALLQTNVKRILAYSSIAHLGYIMVAFLAAKSTDAQGAANLLAVEAVAYYIVAYVLTTLAGFGIVTLFSSRGETPDETRDFDNINDFQGLFWTQPWLATVFIFTLFSLAGIPLTVGFIGKFYVLAAGVQGAMWSMLAVLVVSSGIGLFYYLRLILIMLRDPQEVAAEEGAVSGQGDMALPLGGRCVVAALALIILFLGVYPSPLMESIKAMARTLG